MLHRIAKLQQFQHPHNPQPIALDSGHVGGRVGVVPQIDLNPLPPYSALCLAGSSGPPTPLPLYRIPAVSFSETVRQIATYSTTTHPPTKPTDRERCTRSRSVRDGGIVGVPEGGKPAGAKTDGRRGYIYRSAALSRTRLDLM